MATKKTLEVLGIVRDMDGAGVEVTSQALAARMSWPKKNRRNTASAYLSWFARCGFVKVSGKQKEARRWANVYVLTRWGKRFKE